MARILVVDDAVFMREMLSEILAGAGHTIAGEAGNAKDAVEIYKELRPDIVTLDIIMPKPKGIDTIEAIAQIIRLDKGAKVVIVSSVGQEEAMAKAIKAGARDFIRKPFEPLQIVEVINRLSAE